MNKLDKFLSKLDKKARFVVEEEMSRIVSNQLSGLDLKKLKDGQNLYRVRVGRIRIIFERTKSANLIKDISYRDGNTYSRL